MVLLESFLALERLRVKGDIVFLQGNVVTQNESWRISKWRGYQGVFVVPKSDSLNTVHRLARVILTRCPAPGIRISEAYVPPVAERRSSS